MFLGLRFKFHSVQHPIPYGFLHLENTFRKRNLRYSQSQKPIIGYRYRKLGKSQKLGKPTFFFPVTFPSFDIRFRSQFFLQYCKYGTVQFLEAVAMGVVLAVSFFGHNRIIQQARIIGLFFWHFYYFIWTFRWRSQDSKVPHHHPT